jgi:hypothetical protein
VSRLEACALARTETSSDSSAMSNASVRADAELGMFQRVREPDSEHPKRAQATHPSTPRPVIRQKLFPFENGRNSFSLRDDISTGMILP